MADNTRKVFQNPKEAASITGLPIELFLRARMHPDSNKGTTGFHESARIYYNIPDANGVTLEKWIADHKEELESVTDEDREHWKLRKDRAQALLAEMDLEIANKRVVNKQDVVDLLDRIATAQVSLFNAKLRQELPVRWNLSTEQIAELDSIISEIFTTLTKGIVQWQK